MSYESDLMAAQNAQAEQNITNAWAAQLQNAIEAGVTNLGSQQQTYIAANPNQFPAQAQSLVNRDAVVTNATQQGVPLQTAINTPTSQILEAIENNAANQTITPIVSIPVTTISPSVQSQVSPISQTPAWQSVAANPTTAALAEYLFGGMVQTYDKYTGNFAIQNPYQQYSDLQAKIAATPKVETYGQLISVTPPSQQATPTGGTYYAPTGSRTQTELADIAAVKYTPGGSVGFYQNIYDPNTGKLRNITNLVSSGSAGALQSGMFSEKPLTVDVRTQYTPSKYAPTAMPEYADIVRAQPESFSRLGAEAYGGYVLPLDNRTIESSHAQLSTYPSESGNLASLVSPTAVNRPDYKLGEIPWGSEVLQGSPKVSMVGAETITTKTQALGVGPTVVTGTQPSPISGLYYGIPQDFFASSKGYTRETTTTPGEPSAGNFISNLLGTTLGKFGLGWEGTKGFATTTVTEKRTVELPAPFTSRTKFGYVGEPVIFESTRATTTSEKSVYEDWNTQLSKVTSSISPTLPEKYVTAMGSMDIGIPGAKVGNLLIGGYETARQRPLDIVQNAAFGVVLVAGGEVVGGAATALSAGTRVAPFVATAGKYAPAVFTGLYGGSVVERSTSGLTDFGGKAYQKAGGILSTETAPLFASGIGYGYLGSYEASRLPPTRSEYTKQYGEPIQKQPSPSIQQRIDTLREGIAGTTFKIQQRLSGIENVGAKSGLSYYTEPAIVSSPSMLKSGQIYKYEPSANPEQLLLSTPTIDTIATNKATYFRMDETVPQISKEPTSQKWFSRVTPEEIETGFTNRPSQQQALEYIKKRYPGQEEIFSDYLTQTQMIGRKQVMTELKPEERISKPYKQPMDVSGLNKLFKPTIDVSTMFKPSVDLKTGEILSARGIPVMSGAERAMVISQYGFTPEEVTSARMFGLTLQEVLSSRIKPETLTMQSSKLALGRETQLTKPNVFDLGITSRTGIASIPMESSYKISSPMESVSTMTLQEPSTKRDLRAVPITETGIGAETKRTITTYPQTTTTQTPEGPSYKPIISYKPTGEKLPPTWKPTTEGAIPRIPTDKIIPPIFPKIPGLPGSLGAGAGGSTKGRRARAFVEVLPMGLDISTFTGQAGRASVRRQAKLTSAEKASVKKASRPSQQKSKASESQSMVKYAMNIAKKAMKKRK